MNRKLYSLPHIVRNAVMFFALYYDTSCWFVGILEIIYYFFVCVAGSILSEFVQFCHVMFCQFCPSVAV